MISPSLLTHFLRATTVSLTLASLTTAAAAAQFSQLITFGDSLVDTGNAFIQTGIPAAPYFEGRFSNGLLWNDYVAADLGIPLTNLGFGGASSDQIGGLLFNLQLTDFVPGLLSQVDTYTMTTVDPEALYGLWAGANDYLFLGVNDATGPVNNIANAVTQLRSVGAKDVLLFTLPNLGDLPLVERLGVSAANLNALSTDHNQLLATAVDELNAAGDINVTLFDANALFNPAADVGLVNTQDACLNTPACVNDPGIQATYLFWDGAHPTTSVHRRIADGLLADIAPSHGRDVPEPAMLIGLGLLGLWGVSQAVQQRGWVD